MRMRRAFYPLKKRNLGYLHQLSFVTVCVLLLLCAPLPVPMSRFVPRQTREIRRWLIDWEELAAQLSAEERYGVSLDAMRVKVVSLQRTEQRKSQTVSSLGKQGVPYEIFEAVDGLAGFSEEALAKYAGKRRLKRIQKLSDMSYAEILQAHKSEHLSEPLKSSIHESLRFGCFLSHVMLWEELLESASPYLVVLEDDVILTSHFTIRLLGTMELLPVSWDILFLNGCFKKYGPDFAPGVKLSRGSLCTYGYVISLSAVKKLLSGSSVRQSDKPIDHVLDVEISRGNIFAFHVEPPLVEVVSTIQSTLGY